MNKVLLIGRLVADPEVRWTTGDNPMAVARYKLAVDRKIKKEGAQSADFPSCIAFGKNGEFAKKWLTKGVKIAVEGHLQTSIYTNKDGQTVYTTEVIVDSHEFCESKKSNGNEAPGGYSDDFTPPAYTAPVMPTESDFAMLDGDDSSLPF